MSYREWLRSKNVWGWFSLVIIVAYVVIMIILGIEMLAAKEIAAQEALMK